MDPRIIHSESERQYGCYRWGLIAGLIILSITTTTVLLLLIDKYNSRVLIAFLIVMLIIIGIGSLLFVEFQRRKATRRREQSAHEWVHRTLQDQQTYTLPHNYQAQFTSETDATMGCNGNSGLNQNNHHPGVVYEIPLEKPPYNNFSDYLKI